MKDLAKKLWPDSLGGQLLLTMLLGAAVLQGINLYAVCYIQYTYNAELHKIRYDYDSSIYLALSGMNQDHREDFLQNLSQSRPASSQPSRFNLVAGDSLWASEQSHYADEAVSALRASLAAGSGSSMPLIKARVLDRDPDGLYDPAPGARLGAALQLAIEMEEGLWLEIFQPIFITNPKAVWMQRFFILAESLLFSLLVVCLIKRATGPLSRLGRAAEQFGRNPEKVQPLVPAGSREVREAAQSFNRMRERICGSLNERNRMLEAMGHDLRTPLARIQLRLDKIKPEELREQFSANLLEIESIIEQGLELARSLQTSEEAAPLDVVAFAQSIVDDLADQGLAVSLGGYPESGDEPVLVLARPTCLKRCLENLLTNAVKYAGSAKMVIYRQKGQMVIEVNDNGPGIPDEFLEKVFEPFYRLEGSRNRDSGGTGLGLSIARNMVLLNNGSLFLRNRPEGGLSARVQLSQQALLEQFAV